MQEAVQLIGLEKMTLPHLGADKEVVRSPFFDRDPNLCILCGRCIRACEARGLGVISFISRGSRLESARPLRSLWRIQAAASAGLAWTFAQPAPSRNGAANGQDAQRS